MTLKRVKEDYEMERPLIPRVRRKKEFSTIEEKFSTIEEEFDIDKIRESLETETSCSKEQVTSILEELFRTILPLNMQFITAPMLREMICGIMLVLGFEKQRYEYTRIGVPYADFKKISSQENFEEMLVKHMSFEYDEVKKIIEQMS